MAIALNISAAAREALTKDIARAGLEVPVLSVLWSEGGHRTTNGRFEALSAKWDVGFYEESRLPQKAIEDIGGFRFAFVQGAISERLNGKTLDFVRGKYVVI